jgi:hypothetical protein
MITWHARAYKLRNTALPPLTGPIGVSPEHAGALAQTCPRVAGAFACRPQAAGERARIAGCGLLVGPHRPSARTVPLVQPRHRPLMPRSARRHLLL